MVIQQLWTGSIRFLPQSYLAECLLVLKCDENELQINLPRRPPSSVGSGLPAQAHLEYKRLNDQLHGKRWTNKPRLLILNTLTATVPLCSPRLNVREARVAPSHLPGALFTVCQQAEWLRKGDWLHRKKRKNSNQVPWSPAPLHCPCAKGPNGKQAFGHTRSPSSSPGAY